MPIKTAVIGVYCPPAKKRKVNKVLVKKKTIRFFLALFIAKLVHSFLVLLYSDNSLEVYLLFIISFVEFESYLTGEILV